MIRLYLSKTRVQHQMHLAKLLLLLSKLRALDALIAERLLCLQMNTDGQVQKCIFEVLHREAINIVEVRDLFEVFENDLDWVFLGYGNTFSRCNRYEICLSLIRQMIQCSVPLCFIFAQYFPSNVLCQISMVYIFLHGDFVDF